VLARVAIWCAVSSKAQAAENKTSLEDQERAGRQYAESIDGQVVRVYRVPGHTRDLVFWEDAARSMSAYRLLRQDVEGRKFDVLWALDPDRLGRDPALSNQVLSLITRSGAQLHIDQGNYTVEPGEIGPRYIYSIQSTRAKEEQERRKRHHRQGMEARVLRGLPAGNWPYGYQPIYVNGDAVGGKYHPREIGGVRFATKHYIQGMSYGGLAARLDESEWAPRRAERWSHAMVRRMMHNDHYAGYVTFGTAVNSEPSDKFPAAWDPVTFSAVLDERGRRKRPGNPPATSVSGLAVCARCGWIMTAARKKYAMYYRCNLHAHQGAYGRSCHPNHVRVGELYTAVEQSIGLLTNPAIIREVVRRSIPDRLAAEERVERLLTRVEGLETTRDRLTRLVAEGSVKPDVYRRSDDDLLREIESVERTCRELEARLAAVPDVDEYVASVQGAAKHLRSREWRGSEVVRQALVRSGLRVFCDGGKVVGVRLVLDDRTLECPYIQDIILALRSR